MARKVHMILVHGTWGRGFFPHDRTATKAEDRRWFEPGSVFEISLRQELSAKQIDPVLHDPIKWSGANSFKEREKAAEDLAKKLDTGIGNGDDGPLVLIGHSHGGNVISCALAKAKPLRRPIYVVTLATPFLEVFPTVIPKGRARALMLLLLFSFFSFSLLFSLAAYVVDPLYPTRLNPARWLGAGQPSLLVAITYLIAGLVMMAVMYGGTNLLFTTTTRNFANRLELIKRISSQSAVNRIADHRLVVRAIDDEAALGITIGAVGTRLASLLLSLIGSTRPLLAMLILALLAVASFFLPSPPARNFFAITMMIVFVGGPFLVFLTALMSAGFRAAYGRELALVGIYCEVSAHTAPDGENVLTVTLPGAPAGRLRHYIHSDARCIQEIADWMETHVDFGTPRWSLG